MGKEAKKYSSKPRKVIPQQILQANAQLKITAILQTEAEKIEFKVI